MAHGRSVAECAATAPAAGSRTDRSEFAPPDGLHQRQRFRDGRPRRFVLGGLGTLPEDPDVTGLERRMLGIDQLAEAMDLDAAAGEVHRDRAVKAADGKGHDVIVKVVYPGASTSGQPGATVNVRLNGEQV